MHKFSQIDTKARLIKGGFRMNRIKVLVFLVVAGFGLAFYVLPTEYSKVSGSMLADPISPPTNINATDSVYITKVQISWDGVKGATAYRIFRNTVNNSNTATDIGTTAAAYFFDETSGVGTTYFYWVRAENGGTVSQLSWADQGTRANGEILPGAFQTLDPPTAPTANPVTASKALLGKALFWDEQLSSTKTVSCGTCHQASAGGSDPRTVIGDSRSRNPGPDNAFNTGDDVFGSPGVPQNNLNGTYTSNPLFGIREQVTGRKSPSYLNAAYTRGGLFWDGRANDVFRDQITNSILLTEWGGLESQSAGPPLSSAEMAHGGRNWNQVAANIATAKPLALARKIPNGLKAWIGTRTYPQLFQEVYGTSDVTPARISLAIGTHERTLFSDRTPLDAYVQGIGTLTAEELAGSVVFQEVQCNACHGGSLLSDNSYHNIGVRPASEDLGRAAVSGTADDNARFKTPGLRNTSLRGPFFHNGRQETIENVVEFYDRGGDFDAPNIDHSLIRPLNLTAQQRAELSAFLKRPLVDSRVQLELPPFDRPTLYTQTDRVPVVSGVGRAGSGGQTPTPKAIEPPLLGNTSFTVAISGALGGAPAVLVVDASDPGIGAMIPAAGSFARVLINLGGSGNGNGWGSTVLSIPSDLAFVGRTFYGRWYVTDAGAANGFAVSTLFRFTIFNSTIVATPFDFDGDSKTDVGIYRPNAGGGEWWLSRSSNGGSFATQFGTSTDQPVPADFTGDGKSDISFFRPSTGFWYVLRSEDLSFFATPFGNNGDVPVPSDYDADGKADIAVFRPSNSTWYISKSGGGTTIQQFGLSGDVPVAADYDGDGRTDVAIYRPSLGQWWINKTTVGTIAFQFGTPTDKTVVGDYTGDGKADVAFWRPSTGNWFVLRSEDNSFFAFPFGISTDSPVVGDFDGDGKFDPGVYRSSNTTWYVQHSTGGTLIQQFGTSGDQPLPSVYVR